MKKSNKNLKKKFSFLKKKHYFQQTVDMTVQNPKKKSVSRLIKAEKHNLISKNLPKKNSSRKKISCKLSKLDMREVFYLRPDYVNWRGRVLPQITYKKNKKPFQKKNKIDAPYMSLFIKMFKGFFIKKGLARKAEKALILAIRSIKKSNKISSYFIIKKIIESTKFRLSSRKNYNPKKEVDFVHFFHKETWHGFRQSLRNTKNFFFNEKDNQNINFIKKTEKFIHILFEDGITNEPATLNVSKKKKKNNLRKDIIRKKIENKILSGLAGRRKMEIKKKIILQSKRFSRLKNRLFKRIVMGGYFEPDAF